MQKSLHKRLEKLEREVDELIKKRGQFSLSCICFPKSEAPPVFTSIKEQEIAASVKCPIHGERFEPQRWQVYTYTAIWWYEKRYRVFLSRSEQYRRAWAASFPDWPHREEDDDAVYLVFNDGRKYLGWLKADRVRSGSRSRRQNTQGRSETHRTRRRSRDSATQLRTILTCAGYGGTLD
jgi:hypothetical protein